MVSEVSNGHHSDRYCQVPCQTCMEVYKAYHKVTTIFHSYNIENLFARISVLNELNVCGPTPIPPSKACMVPLSFQYPIVVWFL